MSAATVEVELMARTHCVGCKKPRFGVCAARVGAATLNLCRRCRLANDAEVISADGALPYVAPEPDHTCICGSSPTHTGYCPAGEARS